MKRLPIALKRMLSRIANPSPGMAAISLIVELLGTIGLVSLIFGFLQGLQLQLQTKNLSDIVEANTALLVGYFIMLLVLLKSVVSDLYDWVWSENDSVEMTDEGLKYYLRGVRETYLGSLHMRGQSTPPLVRLNVMMPGEDPQGRACLCIRLVDYRESYTAGELDQAWSMTEGKCGQAWRDKAQRYWDADADKVSEETKRMEMGVKPPETQSLRSVVSTPVLRGNKVIAVLNFDSYQGGHVTLVGDDSIRGVFREAAKEAASLLANYYSKDPL